MKFVPILTCLFILDPEICIRKCLCLFRHYHPNINGKPERYAYNSYNQKKNRSQSVDIQFDNENNEPYRGIKSYRSIDKNKNHFKKQLAKDMKHPLNAEDFKRAKLLTIEDYIIKEDPKHRKYPKNKKLRKHSENQNNYEDQEDPEDPSNDNNHDYRARNAVRSKSKLWPAGDVPYVIYSGFHHKERAIIAKAIQEFQQKSCIQFLPKIKEDKNYIYFGNFSDFVCDSVVGMVGRMQIVDMFRCRTVGQVMHILMHAIGFNDEQTRPDRDQYIKINWKNIDPQVKGDYKIKDQGFVQDLNETYDFNSIMHVDDKHGAKPPSFETVFTTLEPLAPKTIIGQRFGLSAIDVKQINKLYKCQSHLARMKKVEQDEN